MTIPAWKAAPFLFGSGFCALVYQVAWQREFRLVFGASTAASAAVIAIFMGALGAGGWILGRMADRRDDPWRFYARLEALVALTAAATPPLLWAARWAYLGLGGTTVLGPVFGTLLRLVLAALVLLPPMFLAGGALPAAARAVQGEGDRSRRSLAMLYGINTLGAVAGAMASTFALLEMLGTRRTLWLACALNLAVAIVARRVAFPRTSAPAVAVGTVDERPVAAPVLVYSAAAAVGFAFFLMELVWYRMLGPILGGTVYTFGLILAVALCGIGLGGLIYALVGPRRPPTVGAFAATCWAESVLVALPLVLGDRLAVLALRLRPVRPEGLGDHLWGWIAVTAIVVLPAAVVAGAQFPLLVALLGRGRESVGGQLGKAYAWNTIGAIAGALVGGFGILPLLTAPGAWRAAALLLAATGLAAALAGRAHRLTVLACMSGTGAVAAAVLTVPGPSPAWRHSGVGAGRAQLRNDHPNSVRAWIHEQRRWTTWQAEGIESSVALKSNAGLAFVVNGKIDGSARHDAPTQVMSGILGALLHPRPRTSLVIGLGTGSTAGWLASVPSMERTDVVELEPVIAEVARACAPVNRDVLRNPRVALRYADARETLMTTRERYDLIFSEPSNPYRAGVAGLFTRDFYRSAARRLSEQGFFMQWVQAYEVTEDTVRSVLATMSSVFPSVEVWQTQPGDLLFIASIDAPAIDVGELRRRIREEPYREALRVAWQSDSVESVLAHFIAGPELARSALAAGSTVNTDDRNDVEFGFARMLGRHHEAFRVETLRQSARNAGASRSARVTGAIDWAVVDREQLAMRSGLEQKPAGGPGAPTENARAEAHRYFLGDRRAEAALAFARQPRPASGPFEIMLMAEGLADLGDPAAEAYADGLAALEPVAAAVVRARLRAKVGRLDESAALLEQALIAYRADPWPMPRVMRGAIRLAEQVAYARPDLAPRLFAALQEPFSVRLFEAERLGARLRLVALLPSVRCREALEPLEPHIPWRTDVLLYRRNCYEATGDPRLGQAERDLGDFLAGAQPGDDVADPSADASPSPLR